MADIDEKNEMTEMNETVADEVVEPEAAADEAAATDEAADVATDDAAATEEAAPADGEDAASDPAEIDEKMFDKVNRAARLLRNRKAALAEEAEEDAERLNNLIRALKLLELKPKMEQKEMSDLMGMRLRELNQILAQAEKQDIVARIVPEDEDMRKIVVYASEDAIELAQAQGVKRKKLVPQLSAEDAEQLIALLDSVIDPLTAMGLDEDRRGGRDDRRGGREDRRGGGRGFGGRDDRRGGRDDRRGGGRGFGGRDDRRGGYGDRGQRGNFGPRNDRRGGRDDRRGGFGGGRKGGFRG